MCEKASPVGVYVLQLRFSVGSLSEVDSVELGVLVTHVGPFT